MKMLNIRLVPLLISDLILGLTLKVMPQLGQGKRRLFPLFIVPCLCLLVSHSQGEELAGKSKNANAFLYPSYSVNTLLGQVRVGQAKADSGKHSNISWLLSNSVVEDGIYSVEFKPGRKNQYGGKPKGKGGVWESLSLKLSLDLLPKQYYHTSLPMLYGNVLYGNVLYGNNFFDKDTRTHFRVNRSRVIFSISGEWY